MSIKRIISEWLDFTEEQSQALLDVITTENEWKQTQRWTPKGGTEKTIEPDKIKTRNDLIEYLQALGQGKFFGGHNRATFSNDPSQSLSQYWDFAKRLGMVNGIQYDEKNGNPDCMAVFGSSEQQVEERLAALENDLTRGISPKLNQVVGLGTTTRELGKGVSVSEQRSREQLIQQGKKPNEMEMVSLLTGQVVAKFAEKYPKLSYKGVDTIGEAKDRAPGAATTPDTVIQLKNYLESLIKETSPEQKGNAKPLVLYYSNQPFVLRQHSDAVEKMGEGFRVMTVGPALTEKKFTGHIGSIKIILGEIARLMNNAYCSKRKLQLRNDTALTQEELDELATLRGGVVQSNPEMKAQAGNTVVTPVVKVTEAPKVGPSLVGNATPGLWKPALVPSANPLKAKVEPAAPSGSGGP